MMSYFEPFVDPSDGRHPPVDSRWDLENSRTCGAPAVYFHTHLLGEWHSWSHRLRPLPSRRILSANPSRWLVCTAEVSIHTPRYI